ncbi:hypothetical protein JCGZ_18848 [Jatropha curcas]|uniref:Uncharacterized protein n=1 Tax=Jatropha curcas TaxID=180498 RepID=A0A067K0D5_JATCU|nr:hypothetical protein JCGZ_18848 [Jatropha curcas]
MWDSPKVMPPDVQDVTFTPLRDSASSLRFAPPPARGHEAGSDTNCHSPDLISIVRFRVVSGWPGCPYIARLCPLGQGSPTLSAQKRANQVRDYPSYV